MESTRFPYGVSNFSKLVTEGHIYVDRTAFLEKLEQLDSSYHFYLRPRRFGKSLAVSVMEHYYGRQHKGDFERLFGKYYIGQHPTPRANAYMVLKFDFSGIETSTLDSIMSSFHGKVKIGVLDMLWQYPCFFDEKDFEAIESQNDPSQVMAKFLQLARAKAPGEKVFLLVDEYDHFTNEIIAFHPGNFQEIVSRNGPVRKFFEVIKEGTQTGIIDRMFLTGVSAVTLDSLTSGFNIGINLSLDPGLHDFMGFTEEEVGGLLRTAGVPAGELDRVLADVRSWYNGYLFSAEAANRLYNPDMVLYFAMHYRQRKKYPATLLDTNISSDYGKLRRMLGVGDPAGNFEVLEKIIQDGSVSSAITVQFSFERTWTREDFVSLMFYMGLLTVQKAVLSEMVFQVPNHVIRELYYRFFQEILLQRANLHTDDLRMNRRMAALALEEDIQPLKEALVTVLKNLDNRDAMQFGEKHVKTALMALMVPTGVYACYSEHPLGQGYADIALFRRPPILEPKRQYLFELKYLKKSEAAQLEKTAEEGRKQLRGYMAHPSIRAHGDFTAYLWVVVGQEVKVLEEVGI